MRDERLDAGNGSLYYELVTATHAEQPALRTQFESSGRLPSVVSTGAFAIRGERRCRLR